MRLDQTPNQLNLESTSELMIEASGNRRTREVAGRADLMRIPREIYTGSKSETIGLLREYMDELVEKNFEDWEVYMPTYVRLDIGPNNTVVEGDLYDYSYKEEGKCP